MVEKTAHGIPVYRKHQNTVFTGNIGSKYEFLMPMETLTEKWNKYTFWSFISGQHDIFWLYRKTNLFEIIFIYRTRMFFFFLIFQTSQHNYMCIHMSNSYNIKLFCVGGAVYRNNFLNKRCRPLFLNCRFCTALQRNNRTVCPKFGHPAQSQNIYLIK